MRWQGSGPAHNSVHETAGIGVRVETGRQIGINPEPKQASQFQVTGKIIVAALAKALECAGWDGADAPVFNQSFEAPALKALNKKVDVKLIQLTQSDPLTKRANVHPD